MKTTPSTQIREIARKFVDTNGKFICTCDVGVEECPRATHIEQELIKTLTSHTADLCRAVEEEIVIHKALEMAWTGIRTDGTREHINPHTEKIEAYEQVLSLIRGNNKES